MAPPALLKFALVPLGLLLVAGTARPFPDLNRVVLRNRVLDADPPGAKAAAYRSLFEHVGRVGLKDLMKDPDTGLALQAAWEHYKTRVKRATPIPGRVDDVYDPAGLKRFVEFLKDRTKAKVPGWWAEAIVDVDVFTGRHHGFVGKFNGGGPERRVSKERLAVPDGAELELAGDDLVYTAGGRAVRFPKTTIGRGLHTGYVGMVTDKWSVVASYGMSGFAYPVAGFGPTGGRPAWTGTVWASGRSGFISGVHHHWVEMVRDGEMVFVYGAESHGMYTEVFDGKTGTCGFRFCTAYWFDFSEGWGLQ